MVRKQSGSSDTASRVLGNGKDVADKNYIEPTEVLPTFAVKDGLRGLVK